MATTTGSPFPSSDQPPYSGITGSSADNGMGSSMSGSNADEKISRARQGAHEAIDRLADKAGPTVDRVRSKVSGVADTVRARAEQFGEIEEQWMESCRASVREHPLAAVAIAVAAGVILSKMLSSR